ncbi:hypothetical protein A2V49_03180 [candidate division WWE3 bacterium RBG_19FT_COMBO_34_6]|uniref:Type I restriction modification DNA specificity domain-containing protein n=1 Tax=candidate division WWE3 bacterium RBG_19FT_COMBO_34_6 TaxID=1802612 RepID=A0A1F4UJK4_UNCKA|nr:MAG: hypothetical protein A2V49_03180 [candidate division WWE3 bacterium RBG_19FT_COMBO_34_6]
MNRVDILEAVKITNNRVKPFDGKKRYLATGNLSNQGIDNFLFVDYENKPSRADLMVSEGDLILARMKATNKVFLIDCDSEDLIVSTGFLTLKPKDDFDGRYLYHYFRSKTFQQLKDRFCSGATQKAINNNSFKRLKVPHYEIEQQKRIVQILDATDNLRQKRKEQLALLDDYLKSVFLDMFGDPEKFPKCKIKKIAANRKYSLSSGPFGSNLTSKDYVKEGVIVLRGLNVSKGFLDISNVKYISEKKANELIRSEVVPNDIVIVAVGSSGLALRIPKTLPRAIMSQNFNKISPHMGKINPLFLQFYINSDFVQRQFRKKVTDTVRTFLSLTKIKDVEIILPPIEMQDKYSDIFEQVEQIKQKMRASLDEMDNHFNALMQRYFE